MRTLKRILPLTAAALLASCASMPRDQFRSQYEVRFAKPMHQWVVVTTDGNIEKSGQITRTISAGPGVFISAPTGKRQPPYGQEKRSAYGEELGLLLESVGAFQEAQYAEERTPTKTATYVVHANFIETYVGKDGWPTNLVVQVSVFSDADELLMQKIYKGSSGMIFGALSSGCTSCYASDFAEKAINQQFLRDLAALQ